MWLPFRALGRFGFIGRRKYVAAPVVSALAPLQPLRGKGMGVTDNSAQRRCLSGQVVTDEQAGTVSKLLPGTSSTVIAGGVRRFHGVGQHDVEAEAASTWVAFWLGQPCAFSSQLLSVRTGAQAHLVAGGSQCYEGSMSMRELESVLAAAVTWTPPYPDMGSL